MGDPRPERGGRGARAVDVHPLQVAGAGGEGVDRHLADLEPAARAELVPHAQPDAHAPSPQRTTLAAHV